MKKTLSPSRFPADSVILLAALCLKFKKLFNSHMTIYTDFSYKDLVIEWALQL